MMSPTVSYFHLFLLFCCIASFLAYVCVFGNGIGMELEIRLKHEHQHVRIAENKTLNKNKKRTAVHISIYGGSITVGAGLDMLRTGFTSRYSDRYSSILGTMLASSMPYYDFHIQNLGIGGSGVEQWLLCGINPADIVISEFRINEKNRTNLLAWYDMLQNSSKHFIVLDLWSVMNPPTNRSITIPSKKRHNSSYSMLSFQQMYMNNWNEYLDEYFGRPSLNDDQHFLQCLYHYDDIARKGGNHSVLGVGTTLKEAKTYCREYSTYLQHGNANFHSNVSSLLESLIRQAILPKIDHELRNENPERTQHSSICISEFGDASVAFNNWNSAITYNSGFHVGDAYRRPIEKVTLHTNITSAVLELTCPAGMNTSAMIGFIGHGQALVAEAGSFEVRNPRSLISTMLERNDPVRIKTFVGPFPTPVIITVQELVAGAHIELTDFVCSAEQL